MSDSEWRYLALGDSYTIGEKVGVEERFPMQLAAALRAAGRAVGAPEIVARTGWATDELEQGITHHNPKGTYDLVTLLIGVNNQYRGRAAGEYRAEFIALLKRAIGLAGQRPSHVIVLSIPDWGMTPFGRNQKGVSGEIDIFNSINRAETGKWSAQYVDVTPISRRAPREPSLIAPDGLHPSAKMYGLWVELLMPLVMRMNEDQVE